jgi:hypothetical protein
MTSRVASNVVQGSGTDAYSYALSTDPTESFNFPDGLNTWSVEEQETSGAGTSVQSVVTTFSNFDGDAMLTDTCASTASAQHWVTYNTYDQYANVLESAQPSAVDSSDQTGSGYVGSENYAEYGYNSSIAGLDVSLYPSSGLIDVNTYYTSTTATMGTPGGVTGWADQTAVAQGEDQAATAIGDEGGPVLQTSTNYIAAYDSQSGATSRYLLLHQPIDPVPRGGRSPHDDQRLPVQQRRVDALGVGALHAVGLGPMHAANLLGRRAVLRGRGGLD